LAILDHVVPTPLPKMLLRLGRYLLDQGKFDEAAKCFANVRESTSRKESIFTPGAKETREEAISLYDRATKHHGGSATQPVIATSNQPATKANSSAKTGGCFIATAAYGSELSSEVALLSQFRDHVLLRYRAGRLFVKTYYCVSPPMARFIAQSELLRSLTR